MKIELSCPIHSSFRVQQVAGMFDLQHFTGTPSKKAEQTIEFDPPPTDSNWKIGCIVGPSGSGKSTIARNLYAWSTGQISQWAPDKAVIDNFGDVPLKDIVSMLTVVGFSSPPSWIKPYSVLSNGEQFRCDLARALLNGGKGLVVFDEYTSVVDRNVAKIASSALAKGIKSGKIPCQFVAVTCHYDILDWLEPDWVLDTATGKVERRLLRREPRWRRPNIDLEIYQCHPSDWRLFRKHHYLNSKTLSTGAQCYVALWNGVPVSFCAVMASCGHKNVRRISRIVTLPDYQGIGIGKHLLHFVADRYKKKGHRITIGTSHPAMIQSLLKDKQWIFRETAGQETNQGSTKHTKNLRKSIVIGRKIAYFEYVP